MIDLRTLGGTSSVAKGINKSGQVVGWSDNSSGERRAFLYDSTNGMQDLNDLIPADSGWSIGEATAINTDGKIAATGWPPSWRDPCNPYAEYWWPYFDTALVLTPATTGKYEVQGLGTLGGEYSYATGINDSGQVVGRSMTSGCGEQAFLYDSATKQMQVLGTLGTGATYGTIGSEAYGINDSGQVVGLSGIGDGQHHWVSGSGPAYGFIYDSTNGMQDLNGLIPPDSGWTIDKATAISSNGTIAANGHKDGVGQHALLLSPTSGSPPPADTQAPSAPTISSPQNNTYDSDGSFSVSGSAEAGSTVELFEGTTSKGTAKADSSSGAWSIALSGVSEGSHTYSAKATDAAGNTTSASNAVTVTVDKTPPTGSVSINDGASRTRSRSATLTLSATDPSPGSGVSQMRISDTQSGLSSASWEAYSTTKDWTLSSGQGTKTVYVQYRDGADNDSAVATDTIRYAR